MFHFGKNKLIGFILLIVCLCFTSLSFASMPIGDCLSDRPTGECIIDFDSMEGNQDIFSESTGELPDTIVGSLWNVDNIKLDSAEWPVGFSGNAFNGGVSVLKYPIKGSSI